MCPTPYPLHIASCQKETQVGFEQEAGLCLVGDVPGWQGSDRASTEGCEQHGDRSKGTRADGQHASPLWSSVVFSNSVPQFMTRTHTWDSGLCLGRACTRDDIAGFVRDIPFQVSAGRALPVTSSAIYWLALNTAAIFLIDC